jgi:hypothetical protein
MQITQIKKQKTKESSEDEALVLEGTRAEVEKKTNMVASGFEVIDYLSVFDTAGLREGFEFHDNRGVTNEIGFVESSQPASFVKDRQLYLLLKRYVARGKLNPHRLLINGFQESAPQLLVYLHCRPDDSKRPRISFQAFHCFSSFF